MVRINRNPLPHKDLERLFSQLSGALAKLDHKSANTFINELLGYEERITVAKRLAAIVLLVEGYSQYKTAKLLKLSPTTTEKVAAGIQCGEYDGIMKILGKSKKDYFSLLDSLDSILHLGGILPHYNGLDRYKFLR